VIVNTKGEQLSEVEISLANGNGIQAALDAVEEA
jgi:hypothetical protein